MTWPYPRIVAHRGGGALAPENTLEAIRKGASLGFRGVEFDVMLAGDGTPVLIHDETTDRTTGTKGEVSRLAFSQLEKHGIPSYEEAVSLCRALDLWANVEIKPARGHERATGEAAARMTLELWRGAPVQPVMSSFSIEALESARAAAPAAALGYLVDAIPPDWQATLRRLGCVALHCSHEKLDSRMAQTVKRAGYGLLCWTVNQAGRARTLLGWGVDCLVTDALEVIGPGFR